MKIISVKFLNINSLKGHHEIRFDKPPFSDSGLFAITGATGAGKTSILDAITAALYGRVHRHDRDAYECMTRHTGETFSEVEFEANGIVYRSKWSIRRSFGKADGALQTPKMELSNASTGEIIVSQPLSSVQQAIIETCGLDYNQFLRSVMLSQGDFTRFLKANENERSELLEKITDTGIYSEISSFVFQKAKDENGKLEILRAKLKDVELLPEEQSASHKNLLAGIIDKEKDKTGEKKKSEIQLQWLESRDKLNRKKLQLQSQYETFIRIYDSRKDEFDRVRQHQEASVFKPSLATCETNEKQLLDIEKKLSETAVSLPLLEKEKDELLSKTKPAEKALLDAENKQKQLIPVIHETEKKDILIEEKSKELNKKQQEYEASLLALKKLEIGILTSIQGQESLSDQSKENKSKFELLSAQKDSILSGKSIDELENESANLPSLISACERQLELFRRLQNHKKSIEDIKLREKQGIDLLEQETTSLLPLVEKLKNAEELLAELQKNLNLQLKIKDYESDRKSLQNNEPCPLCGSTHHPFVENNYHYEISEAEQKCNTQKEKTIKLSKEAEEKRLYIQKIQTRLEALAEQYKRVENDLSETSANYNENNKKLPQSPAIENEEQIISGITEKQNRLRELSGKIKSIKDIDKSIKEIETSARLQQLIEEENAALLQLKAERFKLFEDKNTEEERRLAEDQIKQSRENAEDLQKALSGKQQTLEIVKSRQAYLLKEHEDAKEQNQSLLAKLTQQLQASGIDSVESLKQRLLPDGEASVMITSFQQSEKEKTEIERLIRDTAQELAAETDKKLTTRTAEELSATVNELDITISQLNQEIGRLKEIIKSDEERKIQFKNIVQEINSQQKETSRWDKLSKLIGSADGKKFSRFAQGLTLARLVDLANRHLSRLTDRYRILKTPGSDLELEITDSYQADIVRSINTLSGGESFLVSLALALGLSDLASKKTQINSLFIDEGFGTLDAETLDVAISSLENLQANGKIIGIISHVEILKERIITQIQVEKKYGGYSDIHIVPES